MSLQAYVTQDETLVTTLTVREAVHYSAELQLPASMSKEEKRERADTTIQEMGLQEAIDTIIGSSWGPTGRGRVCWFESYVITRNYHVY